MGDSQRAGRPADRDIEQAITALKKGAALLKYGRRGKPKFCSFKLSNDESTLLWYSGKEERQLKLCQVSRIIPGQRTAIFQRYPRPEKEYQSFSLICTDRTLDLICKDKEEAEVWFVGLKALIPNGCWRKWRGEIKKTIASTDILNSKKDPGESHALLETSSNAGLGKAFSDIILFTAASDNCSHTESPKGVSSLPSPHCVDNYNAQRSLSDNNRVSLSSAVSSSSQGSSHDDFDISGDCFIWGEGIGEGFLGGGELRCGRLTGNKMNAQLPKALESTVVLDVHYIACGNHHAALVTKQGEIFSWGEELGGRLGHGVEIDISRPKLIKVLTGMNIEVVACGEYHTCVVTLTGDLFTWGDGNSGILGHGSEAGHLIPKKVCGPMEGLHVSYVSCGPWHTSVLTSSGRLFTFGDGSFGALGHGDRSSCQTPREVESLKGAQTIRVACGSWHTAAIVEMLGSNGSGGECVDKFFTGKLFTWGDGDKGQLGHGGKEARLVPECIVSLEDIRFARIACGRDFTVGLSVSGRVFTMGSASYGQLGCLKADGKTPSSVGGKISYSFVEEVSCGSHHVAVLTSKSEVFTWGKGTNGQLGLGDTDDRKEPTFVDFLKDKQVKSVACGTNFTAAICIHKWISGTDHSTCNSCHNPFNFRRKRHNCYNCGLVFCKACSSRKALKAALAPNMSKPYRVCDDCYLKLIKNVETGLVAQIPRSFSKGNNLHKSPKLVKKETPSFSLMGPISKLPFLDSLKRSNGLVSKSGGKMEKLKIDIPPTYSGYIHSGGPSSSTSHYGVSNKRVSASPPGSRMVSRASSPISLRSGSLLMPSFCAPSSPECVTHDPKRLVADLTQEIIDLRMQVEKLTFRNEVLESEVEKTSKQLKEAKAAVADEAEKSKAAKEVIKSLTSQLKEMAERVQDGAGRVGNLQSDVGFTHSITNDASTDNSFTCLVSPTSESDITTMNSMSGSESKAKAEKSEWVVQDEAGVYITLCTLPGGVNELKRVRFSRKRFTQEQAEKWWAEHETEVLRRHNIQSE